MLCHLDPAWYFREDSLVLQDDFFVILLQGVLRSSPTGTTGMSRWAARPRGASTGGEVSDNLCFSRLIWYSWVRFASPGLPYPVVHLPHPVDDPVRPLLLGQEFALRRWYEHHDQVSGPKYAQLGTPVVDPGLGLLRLSEVVPDDGPDLGHAVPHLLHVVHHGAMGGWPTLPRLLGKVEESPWSSPIQ